MNDPFAARALLIADRNAERGIAWKEFVVLALTVALSIALIRWHG